MLGSALALVLFLQGSGVVSGQLRSLEGNPAIAVRVAAIPAPTETTRPSFGSQYFYAQPPVSTTLTDNQGRYRLMNVPPGRYFIVSGVTYYPSTVDADRAVVVTVGANSTTDSLDFQLQRQFGGRVSGRVTPKPEADKQEKAILSGVN